METLKKIAATYAALLPLILLVIAGGDWFYNSVLIPDIQGKTKGGLGNELSEALGVKREFVGSELAKMHAFVMDSMPKYHGLAGVVLEELQTVDVGLKVDKATSEAEYLAPDGRRYQVVRRDTGQFKGYFYYMDVTGKTHWCW